MRRYERDKPGELIPIDIEKFGRFERVGHRITSDRTGQSSEQRRGDLPAFLFRDNEQRPHSGINGSPPISRLNPAEDNLSMLPIEPATQTPK